MYQSKQKRLPRCQALGANQYLSVQVARNVHQPRPFWSSDVKKSTEVPKMLRKNIFADLTLALHVPMPTPLFSGSCV